MAVEVSARTASRDGTRASDVTWQLPREVTRGEIQERGRTLLGNQPTSLTLDITKFKRCVPTTEPDLLDMLTLARRLGVEISLRVNRSSRGRRGDIADRYADTFTRTTVGFVLAELATSIRDESGRDHKSYVQARVENALIENHGVIGRGDQRVIPIYPDFRLSTAAVALERHPKAFRQLMLEHLRRLIPDARLSPQVARISTCAREAIDNVRTHATKQLPPAQHATLGFVSIRRISPQQVGALAESSPEPLKDHYRREARAESKRHHVELTIADNGGGIAATMAGTRNVYAGDADIEDELREVTRALGRGTSIKHGNSGRGLGFPQMLRDIGTAHGVMMIKSGRVCTHAIGASPHAELAPPERLDYPVGTTLVFVCPAPTGGYLA